MSVFMENDVQAGPVMENASLLEATQDGVEVSSLFDPPRTIPGVRVARIDFMNGQVFLAEIEPA